LDNFRLFNRLSKAFEKAKEDKILRLEEAEYSFLKTNIQLNIPAIWGVKTEFRTELDKFLELESLDNGSKKDPDKA